MILKNRQKLNFWLTSQVSVLCMCLLLFLLCLPPLRVILDLGGPKLLQNCLFFEDLVEEKCLVFVIHRISIYWRCSTPTCFRSPMRPKLAKSLVFPRISNENRYVFDPRTLPIRLELGILLSFTGF